MSHPLRRDTLFQAYDPAVAAANEHEGVADHDSEMGDFLAALRAPDGNTNRKAKGNMSTPSRDEFATLVENAELRMDSRVVRLESKIDVYLAQSAERDKRIELLAESAARSAERASNLKGAFWGAVITVVLSVAAIAISTFYATQSSNIAIVQTTISAFQQGQATPPPRK